MTIDDNIRKTLKRINGCTAKLQEVMNKPDISDDELESIAIWCDIIRTSTNYVMGTIRKIKEASN